MINPIGIYKTWTAKKMTEQKVDRDHFLIQPFALSENGSQIQSDADIGPEA